MKTIVYLSVGALLTATILGFSLKKPVAQNLSPECYISCFNIATSEMIQLDANKTGFAALHENPKDFILENPLGEMISMPSVDGINASGYFIKSKKKSNNWLIVIQEWWGLNDYIKKEAEKYYNNLQNVNVIAVDMYDGKVATTRDSATVYMSGAKKERLENIVKSAIAFAGEKAKIFTVGWCFGGGWSLQTSILAAEQANGCIMFYGRPEKDVERLKILNCDVIGFFGNLDKGIPASTIESFEANMKAASKTATIYRYEAGHGFANPSNPSYNQEATADAFEKAINFLKQRM
ncbi:MAG: dienelactone hydrolase family protein [Chitinophagaceae bacterium]|nr:dienelactone hydrolase family protein [Chitinophagaceae bacterium]